jgi:phage terminase large subunit-like protein
VTTLQDPPVLVGSSTPRLWTPPLVTGPSGSCGCGCSLSPATSLGFQAVEFAEGVLNVKLFGWQRYWLIHALETAPNGMFRFRTILTLISRQNGKTHLLKVLSLYLLYLGHARLILGAAQSLDLAREAWRGAVDMAEAVPDLREEIQQVLKSTVEYSLILQSGARYRITAANDKAGRGLSVDALILDELRTHKDSAAWAALSNTTMARPNSLIIGISNAGDDSSIVLNDLRAEALARTDPTLGLFEWSAPDGCAIDDRQGWAQANPALGYAVTEQKLMSALRTSRPQD